jgi:hypothetical protein
LLRPDRGKACDVPGLAQLVSAVFRRASRWRAARAFHPRGVLFDARVTLTERESATAAALGGSGERPALVRLSKGIGTPGALPDLLGVAVRAEVAGHVLDVLFSSTGRHRVTGRLLAPSTGWGQRPYSTIMPYRAAGNRVILGLTPEDAQRGGPADPASAPVPLTFTLTEQERGRARRPIGRLVLEAAHPDEPISFDPLLNAHPQLRPAPPLRRLRAWAYTGSRRGRGADPGELGRLP